MKFFRFLAVSCTALCLTLLWACDPSTGPAVTLPAAVDSLQATSVNQTTVRIRWSAPLNRDGVTGYRVTVLPAQDGATPIGSFDAANTIADITGLTAGTVYIFRVQSRSADTVSVARDIRWSPAVRVTMMQGGPIRIYETASGFGSGLRIQGGVAQNLTVANGNQWDLGIQTRTANLIIGSPGFLEYSGITSPRATRTGDNVFTGIDSLNQVFDTQVQMGTPGVFTVPPTVNKGFVFAFQTVEGNFGKIFVKASPTGAILQGISPNRYIEVEISYQPVANVPYAIAPTLVGTRSRNFDGITFTQFGE